MLCYSYSGDFFLIEIAIRLVPATSNNQTSGPMQYLRFQKQTKPRQSQYGIKITESLS